MSSRKYFDEVAQDWDGMRQSFFSEAVREKAISVAGVKQGGVAADIGAGTGFMTEALLQRGLKVITVDQSEAMIRKMKGKFRDQHAIDFRVGEADSLPIEDRSLDYVFANMLLHHVREPPDAVQEMVRVLKPNGMLVITDLDEHRFEFLRKEHHDRWMGFKREDVNQWLTGAGLKNVQVDCIGEDCCARSSCGKECASVSIFVASGRK